MTRLLSVLIFVAFLPLSARAQQQIDPRDVLSVYRDLNDLCRAPSASELNKVPACNARAKIARLLNSLGYCYGSQSEDAADMRWHKCAEHELF
jgi:hypothetical protein